MRASSLVIAAAAAASATEIRFAAEKGCGGTYVACSDIDSTVRLSPTLLFLLLYLPTKILSGPYYHPTTDQPRIDMLHPWRLSRNDRSIRQHTRARHSSRV